MLVAIVYVAKLRYMYKGGHTKRFLATASIYLCVLIFCELASAYATSSEEGLERLEVGNLPLLIPSLIFV